MLFKFSRKLAGRMAAAVVVCFVMSTPAYAFPTFHLSALTATFKKARIRTEPGYRAPRRHAYCSLMETQPVYIDAIVESQSSSSIAINCSVTLDQVSSTGTSVQVNCDRPDLIASPSGTWPYVLNFPAGSETRSVTLVGSSSAVFAGVHFYTCEAGVNINDPANWKATTPLTLKQEVAR